MGRFKNWLGKQPKRRSVIAADLRKPKYKPRIIPNKKKQIKKWSPREGADS